MRHKSPGLQAEPCAEVLKQLVMKKFKHGEPLLSVGAKDRGRRKGLALMVAVGLGQEERLVSDVGCRTMAGQKACLRWWLWATKGSKVLHQPTCCSISLW